MMSSVRHVNQGEISKVRKTEITLLPCKNTSLALVALSIEFSNLILFQTLTVTILNILFCTLLLNICCLSF